MLMLIVGSGSGSGRDNGSGSDDTCTCGSCVRAKSSGLAAVRVPSLPVISGKGTLRASADAVLGSYASRALPSLCSLCSLCSLSSLSSWSRVRQRKSTSHRCAWSWSEVSRERGGAPMALTGPKLEATKTSSSKG